MVLLLFISLNIFVVYTVQPVLAWFFFKDIRWDMIRTQYSRINTTELLDARIMTE